MVEVEIAERVVHRASGDEFLPLNGVGMVAEDAPRPRVDPPPRQALLPRRRVRGVLPLLAPMRRDEDRAVRAAQILQLRFDRFLGEQQRAAIVAALQASEDGAAYAAHRQLGEGVLLQAVGEGARLGAEPPGHLGDHARSCVGGVVVRQVQRREPGRAHDGQDRRVADDAVGLVRARGGAGDRALQVAHGGHAAKKRRVVRAAARQPISGEQQSHVKPQARDQPALPDHETTGLNFPFFSRGRSVRRTGAIFTAPKMA